MTLEGSASTYVSDLGCIYWRLQWGIVGCFFVSALCICRARSDGSDAYNHHGKWATKARCIRNLVIYWYETPPKPPSVCTEPPLYGNSQEFPRKGRFRGGNSKGNSSDSRPREFPLWEFEVTNRYVSTGSTLPALSTIGFIYYWYVSTGSTLPGLPCRTTRRFVPFGARRKSNVTGAFKLLV